jgi:hypothetical protein
MNLDKILSNFKDYHLPIFVGMFGVGCVLQWFHHLDMAFVAFTGTVIGGITGHAFSPAQAVPDPPAAAPTVDTNTSGSTPTAPGTGSGGAKG